MKNPLVKLFAKGAIIVLILYAGLYAQLYYDGIPPEELAASQSYEPGTGNIQGQVDTAFWKSLGAEFEIGANAEGYAVFKDPKAAMDKVCKDYAEGISLMQERGAPNNYRKNYQAFVHEYGGARGTPEAEAQLRVVSGFPDIYENSFYHEGGGGDKAKTGFPFIFIIIAAAGLIFYKTVLLKTLFRVTEEEIKAREAALEAKRAQMMKWKK